MKYWASALLATLLIVSFFVLSLPAEAHKHTYHKKHYTQLHHKGVHLKRHLWKYRTHAKAVVIPDTMDLSKYVYVLDQKNLGSCWAHSIVEVLQGTYSVAGKDPGILSTEYEDHCTQSGDCDGGDFSDAEAVVCPKGPPLMSQWPYTATCGGTEDCHKYPVAACAQSWNMIGAYGSNPSPQAMITAMITEGAKYGVPAIPLSIDVAATSEWEAYSDGIYNGCDGDSSGINHMIALIGWNLHGEQFGADGWPQKGSKMEFLLQNEWGTTWGDGGRMHSLMVSPNDNHQKCNAAGYDAMFFEIALPLPTPTPSRGWL